MIGNYDGIHKGHQKVIDQARKKAKKNKLKLGLVTFEPIPNTFFNKLKNYRVNSYEQKIEQFELQSLDFVVIKKFDRKFSKNHYLDFMKILSKKISARFIFVSNNFKFGKQRKGNVGILKKYSKKFNFVTIVTKPLKIHGSIVSSSKIRNFITFGKIGKANKLLGRSWSVEGTVKKGDQRGRLIGFPTCNIKLKDYIIPKLGVYSVLVKINNQNKSFKGIANLGYRPTFGGKELLLEVNIFGFKKNIYNEKIKVFFKRFIRPEKKFKNLESLKKQIKIDINKAR